MFNGFDKETAEAYKRRTIYADALNKSLEIFVSYTEKAFNDVMSNGLRPVAEAAGLDRIIIFRIFGLKSNSAGEIYRWDKAEGGTAPVDPVLKALPVTSALKRWISIVSDDTCISLRRSDFAEDEAAFLGPRGVQSILIVPVFTEGEFWGVVTFHDNTDERDFDENCTGLLRSAARLCAATIIREEKTRNVDRMMEESKRHEKMTDTLNKAAVIFLSQSEKKFEDTMAAGVSLIADMADIDRLVLYRNCVATDGLHMSQVYRWDRNSGGTTEILDSYMDVSYTQLIPDWTYLSDGNSINGPVKLLPDKEASVLQAFGIVSVAAIPVFINSAFWGFALFGDVRNERNFDDDIIEMMRSAAFLFANAFIRTEMEREISDENELVHVMFDAAPIGLTIYDENLHFTDCNDAVLNMHGAVNKQYYLDHFLDFLPEYQPDGKKTTDRLSDIMKLALNGEMVVTEWMHNTLSGEPIPCELVLTRVKHRDKYIGLGYVYDLRNIKEMEKNIQWLETEADKIYYDPLTGIYNRRYFDEGLHRVLKSLSRSEGALSLMMIDIDFFKNYNDTYGHSEGDKCLKIIAETLKETITRADDFVARYGGEEFVVVLPNTREKGARMIAARLLGNIRNCNIPHKKSAAAEFVTISIGVTTGKVGHMHTEEEFIQHADKMLYQSKQDGRNRYTFGKL